MNFTPRLYQEAIFATAVHYNTLAVLPTGLGKTAIALMLAQHQLNNKKKILLLAPTRPLIEQHQTTFEQNLDEQIISVSGKISPTKRKDIYKEHNIVIATPQLIENDLVNNVINPKDFSTLIVDEAHRAVGDYAYVWIAKKFNEKNVKILGLTASPGANEETINEVLQNLYIDQIEYRSQDDPDVKPYMQETEIIYDKVQLSEEYKIALKYLQDCYGKKLRGVQTLGFADKLPQNKTEVLKLQKFLYAKMLKGAKDFQLLKSISLTAEAMKVEHALMLVETQGLSAALAYMEDLEDDAKTSKSKAVKNLIGDPSFRSAITKIRYMLEDNKEHPKLVRVQQLIQEELKKKPKAKIIVFNQYRDQALRLKEKLDLLRDVDSRLFFGQAKKRGYGLSQKEQKELIKQFSLGAFNVMLMTSVGEEGLDIPSVDLVIFYEPVPSNIRTIQRRGRTGRHDKGKVIVLMTEKTRDEAFRWVAYHKEKKMYKVLEKVKKNFDKKVVRKEKPLAEFEKNKHDEILDRVIGMQKEDKVLFVDFREKTSHVVKHLIDSGVKVEMRQLDVADYVLSSNVAIEYKTAEDFVASILDKRIFEQMVGMKKYPAPVLIIEGYGRIFGVRNVHPNAIRGVLSAISVDFGIPIIPTVDEEDSAAMIKQMLLREHQHDRSISFKDARATTVGQMQEQIIASLPGIGSTLAVPLLEHFGTVEKVFSASQKELEEVEGIGKKRASTIRDLLEKDYI